MTDNFIAGVPLEDSNGLPCRVHVAAVSFASNFAVAASVALDGTAGAVAVDVASRPFTVRIPYCPATVLQAIVAAVNSALALGQPLRVTLPAALTDVDHLCVPSGAQWFQYDETSRGEIIKNVTFSFVALEEYSA